jgi:hypothetical protein
MRGAFLGGLFALCAGACALPAYEVDPSLGSGGSGAGTAGSSSAGSTGNSGSGGDGGASRESACIMYCGIYTQACAGHEANTYASASQCVSVCANSDWPFDGGIDLDASNSLQCRLTHSEFARDMGQDPHCYHASATPSRGACE